MFITHTPSCGSVATYLPSFSGALYSACCSVSGAARAALRELHEETGYGVESSGSKVNVQMVSGTMANDPGLTGANMKLCIVRIDLDQDAPDPIAQPDEGEFIEKHLLPLRELHSHIKGTR